MDFDILQILFFGGLAVFLAIRLYGVLGQSTGRTHEDEQRERQERERERAAAADPVIDSADPAAPQSATITPLFTGPASSGLRAIAEADPSFDPNTFVEGARQAYEMIVTAFANDDRDALEPLLSARVFKAYAAAIEARVDAGQRLDTKIIRMKSASIEEASLNDNRAKVRVAFSVELASALTDDDGQVLEGDINRLKTVDEVWSFERDITSTNPNWRLAGVKTG